MNYKKVFELVVTGANTKNTKNAVIQRKYKNYSIFVKNADVSKNCKGFKIFQSYIKVLSICANFQVFGILPF